MMTEIRARKVIVNCDGASRGNPGPSAVGVSVRDGDTGKVLREFGRRIGRRTNNAAEYLAVIEGLKTAAKFTDGQARVISDSQLVLRQLNGRYRTKKAHLRRLRDRVKELEKHFEGVEYIHVDRENNTRPDELANEALDQT